MIEGFNKWIYCNGISIYRVYFGDRPESFLLSSTPEITDLKQIQFTDWFHKTSKGLLLQKLKPTNPITSSLVLLDTSSHILTTILDSIPFQNWIIETKFNNKFELINKFKSRTSKLSFEI